MLYYGTLNIGIRSQTEGSGENKGRKWGSGTRNTPPFNRPVASTSTRSEDKMTIRQAILKRIQYTPARELLAKIPEGYSIKQAEEAGLIREDDGYFLAVFLSANWEKIYNV
mgnify:CR=1 FL=1